MNLYNYYISKIREIPNKRHHLVRYYKKLVNEHIGGLRINVIHKVGGDACIRWANKEANRLEKELASALAGE